MLYLDELHQSLNQRHNGLGRNTAHLRTTSLQPTGHLHHFHWTYLGTDRIVNQIWIRSIKNRAKDALIIAVQTLKKIHQPIYGHAFVIQHFCTGLSLHLFVIRLVVICIWWKNLHTWASSCASVSVRGGVLLPSTVESKASLSSIGRLSSPTSFLASCFRFPSFPAWWLAYVPVFKDIGWDHQSTSSST